MMQARLLPEKANMPSIAERIESMALTDREAGSIGPWSTGEKLAVCLVLDRPDWLKTMNYTMLEAVDRLGPEWLDACQEVRKAGVV